ncbi:LysM peptidoglycan-binding domain-containing protein [Aspergillus puulaauensis]|uniref:LysM domain-containing protein n=1 Tax=Aspergillus puulaauensis TaxID=1220207 RepID=A0A7R7XF88_9EURO|nr:uncharacterized protein APUU_20006A [Aspergillus puulaauensis]BCS19574.1 hypothetical protein APUU_20006A [Aspergillus puulaauensis]
MPTARIHSVLWLAFGLGALGQRFTDGTGYDIDLPGVSGSCKEVINSTIACDRFLASALDRGTPPSADRLDKVCDQDCVKSLKDYREKVKKACTGKFDIIVADDIAYNATYTADELLYSYNTDAYCWIELARINDTLTPEEECSDCLLGRYQIDLNSPFGYTKKLAKGFSSLVSSCSATGYPVTSPTPIALNGTDAPTPTPVSCSQSGKYTIKDSDDCKSISVAHNVSTWALLHHNGLQAYCQNFPGKGTSLCLPKQCDIYTLKENDTCDGIVDSYPGDISVTQLRSWNPFINKMCGNLFQWTGYQICVSPPGSDLDPVPSPTPSPTKCEGLWQPTSCEMPPPTDIIWPDDPGVIGQPLAKGTWSNCTAYTTYLNSSAPEYDNTYRNVARFYEVSVANLQKWNPSLGKNSTDCQIKKGYRYCAVYDVERAPAPTTTTSSTPKPTGSPSTSPSDSPSPTSTSTTTTKTTTSTTTSPTTDPTPSPVQDGITKSCNKFYKVEKDDDCYGIAKDKKISEEDFYKWNPAVKDDCSMLLYGFYVCVGVSK